MRPSAPWSSPFFLLPLVLALSLPPGRLSYLEFTYGKNDKRGPENWGKVAFEDEDGKPIHDYAEFVKKDDVNLKMGDNACSGPNKGRQSPINLVPNGECGSEHEILTRLVRPTDCVLDDLQFRIAPHLLRARFPTLDNPDFGGCRRPTIDAPNGFPSHFTAVWIEFKVRSEHVIDGRRYDGEIVLSHVGSGGSWRKIGNISILLEATAYTDQPVVQSFIDRFQARAAEVKENCANDEPEKNRQDTGFGRGDVEALNNATEALSSETGSRRWLEQDRVDFPQFYGPDGELLQAVSLAETGGTDGRKTKGIRAKPFPYDMFPTIYWYRYSGSLTVPPCSENVLWHVLDRPLQISRAQLRELAELIADYQDEETCEKATAATSRGEVTRPLQVYNLEDYNVTHCTEEHYDDWLYDDGHF